ncbi:IclR family transcriptional regulator [Amycolatopsis panacis]|uniref:IclR family transcriptional regulator n=1 Tax=Amycolatopsis panacis TaxID=2340917 RepID=UPI001F1C1C7A|nr:IclR family transcriptional regulator [Amycolatopsis panacis]
MAQSESNKPVAAVLNTFRVLEEVARRQPIGVSELARATEMPKSSVQRCLMTLQHVGWLRMVDPERARWGVTTKPLGIGLRAAGEEGLREAAQPFLEELRDVTEETIHLTVCDGGSLIIIARRDSPQPVRTFVEIGTRAPIHATASGLAMMAHMGDDELDRVLGTDLQKYTRSTLVDRSGVLAEVERTRKRGYAVNDASMWRPDVSAIAAAVTTSSGRPIAAVAISIPSSRFDRKRFRFYGDHALETAAKISEAIQKL